MRKPFQMQIAETQAHNQPCQECAGHCSKKDLYGTAGEVVPCPVEFSSDSLPCKMVVKLYLLMCLAFLRVTAGEILSYCTDLSRVHVPHRHNSAV